jgi:hypothetical protein
MPINSPKNNKVISVATLAEAERVWAEPNILLWVEATQTLYKYKSTTAARDGIVVLNAMQGGNNKWVAVSNSSVPAWIDCNSPSIYLNAWQGVGGNPVKYTIANGEVIFKGRAWNGVAGNPIIGMPAGLRPTEDRSFIVETSATATIMTVVAATGAISNSFWSSALPGVCFDGVRYKVF